MKALSLKMFVVACLSLFCFGYNHATVTADFVNVENLEKERQLFVDSLSQIYQGTVEQEQFDAIQERLGNDFDKDKACLIAGEMLAIKAVKDENVVGFLMFEPVAPGATELKMRRVAIDMTYSSDVVAALKAFILGQYPTIETLVTVLHEKLELEQGLLSVFGL